MRILDPGHKYELATLDGDEPEILTFVKRIGEKYPGNQAPSYGGTQTQEVLRALLDRTRYVDAQIHFTENDLVIQHLTHALWWLESRAARARGEFLSAQEDIETMPRCKTCGHVQCRLHATEAQRERGGGER